MQFRFALAAVIALLATVAWSRSGGAQGYPQDGCWVQIFEDENYQDSSDIVAGPGSWTNLRKLPGASKEDWGDEIDSVKVGPHATLELWEDEDFNDNHVVFGPGTEKTNLRGDPDMGDQADSMRITCQ
jgi:hypothetical protein